MGSKHDRGEDSLVNFNTDVLVGGDKNDKLDVIPMKLRMCDTDYNRIEKDNTVVLSAKLWDDLKESKEKSELYYALRLLGKIVERTGNFYERRMQSSGMLRYLIGVHNGRDFTEIERKRYDEYFNVVKNFLEKCVPTKKSYEQIFDSCLDLYTHMRDRCEDVLS
jgi:hypothetical protein